MRVWRCILASAATGLLHLLPPSALAQCPPNYVQTFDGVRAPLLPGDWIASQGINATGAPLWASSTTTPFTAANDAFSPAADDILDNRLDIGVFLTPFDPAFSFYSNYNLEPGKDGAVIEVSTPNVNGGAFTDITDPAINGSVNPTYNSIISTAFQSPIAGRHAWSGNSGGYVITFIDLFNLSITSPNSVTLRFRLVSDNSNVSPGWRIDQFVAYHIECSSPTPTPPPPTPTPTATATATPIATPCGPNLIADSTFETGTPWSNWTIQTSTHFDTPLCNTARCGTDQGLAPPYSGDNWAWFGGANVPETATLGQSVIIPAGSQATLNFLMRIGAISSPLDDVLNVKVDGTVVQSYPEPNPSENAYRLRTVDLSAFADGASHSILFEYIAPGTSKSDYVIDNVTLNLGPACASPTPGPATHLAVVAPGAVPQYKLFTFTVTAQDQFNNTATGYTGTVHFTSTDTGPGTSLPGDSTLSNGTGTFIATLGSAGNQTITATDTINASIIGTSNPIFVLLEGSPTPTATATATATPTPSPTATATVTPPTLIVTTTADSGPGSLRQALADAHDGDYVQFDPALNGQTVTLTTGELIIDKNLTISGPGSTLLTVSRSAQAAHFRIFHIQAGHTVSIQGLTISGGFDHGGAIFNGDASLSIISCVIRDNVSPGSGGAIFNSGSSGTATLTILDSTITVNQANSWGGGIYNQAADFTGGASLTLTNSVVSYNQALDPTTGSGLGGGICSFPGVGVTLNNSTVSHNTAGTMGPPAPGGHGGGIAINGCTLTITDSTISDNQSGATGGGIENQSGILTVMNSSLIGNRAFGRGGGIYTGGWSKIINSTLSDNYAGVSGGGIFNTFSTEVLRIAHSTLSGNRADEGGGGISNSDALEIGDTILKAGSAGANILNKGGTVTSHGYNLSSDDGGGVLTANGDQINTDPILGPLQNNGGPTFTHELLNGSPAIDAGNPAFTPPPTTDQRGYLRVFNARIDIGSFEVQPVPTPTPSPFTAQLANISTRLRVETGENIGIGGFIINGAGSLQVVIRGIGPSLGQLGIPDFLPDPVIELRDSSGALIVTNDNWQDDPAQATQLTKLGLAPGNQAESALVRVFQPGAYTVIVAGKNGGTGIGLIEVYNVDQSVPPGTIELANISTRGLVQTGNNVMIGGFILTGAISENAQVAVRGIGPSLTPFGITNALADPTLELRDSNGALLMVNDNWQDDPASAAQLTAHGLAPQNTLESGIYMSLSPGLYTAILAGNDAGTGIGLVEIYNVN